MARTFAGTAVFNDSTTLARSLRGVSTLRLVLGLTALLAASMGIVALGAAYMLSSAANLAARRGSAPIPLANDAARLALHAQARRKETAGSGTRRAATLGVVLALATVLSLFTLLLFDALE